MDTATRFDLQQGGKLDLRQLTENVSVSAQITVADVNEIAAQGFTLIINNRPDGEADDQPAGEEIREAAERAGCAYLAIPVDHWGLYELQALRLSAALQRAKGKVLLYCRSGTRSTFLWALAAAGGGREPQEIIGAADAAGYDVSLIEESLEALARWPTGKRLRR